MSKERRNILMLRWSVFSTTIIAIVWLVWYFVFNGIPQTQIQFQKTWDWDLPFDNPPFLSFLSYVLIGPIYTISLLFSIFKVKQNPENELMIAIWTGIFMGLLTSAFYVLGVYSALAMSIFSFIVYGFIVGMCYTLMISAIRNPIAGMITGVATSWSYTLIASLFISPIVGAITVFVFNAGVGLIFLITYGIRYFFKNTIAGLIIKDWFLAKNK